MIAGTYRAALAVRRLTLSDFRCYARARIEDADGRPVVLTGPNGAGKTNLLEAISFLSPGRGLRRARLAEIQRIGGSGGWAVAVTVDTPAGPVEIGTGLDPLQGEAERRAVRIDGHPARSQTALADHVAVAWLTPRMDRLFQDGAGGRRRFLDRLVFGFDPAHAGRLARYEHAMRERVRLLREGRGSDAWCGALEQVMAETGIAIAAARRDVVARLGMACAQGVGPFPFPELAVAGSVEDDLARMPALEAEDALRAGLAALRRQAAESGATALGPHRSDLAVRHRAKDMPAERCSTGEQKALLVALVLATARVMAAERGSPPILLLDEVAAHLDGERRAALFEEICALGTQAWLTGTDETLFDGFGPRARFYRVADAVITPRP